jgi:hypothetical protein
MGVVYKLKPEIGDFILKEKKNHPALSCRKLAVLVNKKFPIKLSKSHINSLIKIARLSNPVGRTPKPKRGYIEAEGLGAFMLKAADALIGGVDYFVQIIKERVKARPDLGELTETLVYQPLFGEEIKPDSGLWKLVNKPYIDRDFSSYLNELQGVTSLNTDMVAIISRIFKEVLFLKITFPDESVFYIDGQFHTLWSSPNIPNDFSLTLYKINSYINKYFMEGHPLIFFMAPGYDLFPREWLDFLIKLGSTNKEIKISLLGGKFQGLETTNIPEPKNCSFIFGLWPWQHIKYREVEFLGEFKPFSFGPKKEEFYLAETRVKLSQPNTNQSVILRGAVLKRSRETKTNLVILSNIPSEKAQVIDIVRSYLNLWPTPEESLKDFSRKIELFTYSAAARKIFSAENLPLFREMGLSIKENLRDYLYGLDVFVRWFFLPPEYKEMDFSTTKERFYNLRAKVKKQKDICLVSFILPESYPFLKDLAYAIARMNEKEIILPDGKRLWFMNL